MQKKAIYSTFWNMYLTATSNQFQEQSELPERKQQFLHFSTNNKKNLLSL